MEEPQMGTMMFTESFKVGERKTLVRFVSNDHDMFRPMRIIIPESIATFYIIHSIRIDGEEQFAEPGYGVPGAVFSNAAAGAHLDLERANEKISIEVERIEDRMPRLVRAIRRWLQIDAPESKLFTACMLGYIYEN